ncbi:MAG: FHA domain-containing protein [Burkholderiales bacterium]|nr:FHA domain-containing protein [Burkholderiales bacterium]
MAKFILSMDGLVLKEIPVSKERMTIGRKPHNDIQIDNLAVSGEHAVVVTILNDSFLEDLGSTNGTLVNGQPIKKHFLQHNDVVELGKYKLKYVNEQAQQHRAAPQDFEKTMVLRPGQVPKVEPGKPASESQQMRAPGVSQPVGVSQPNPALSESQAMRAGQGAPAASQPMGVSQQVSTSQPMGASQPVAGGKQVPPAAIQILTGANAGRELELVKPLTTLGKPGVQVAVITRRPQGYFITHVEGATFPVVNGKALDAQAHALADHDVIELAGVKMEFFFKT